MEFHMDHEARAHIEVLIDNMLENKLGPMMKAEVIKNTPVDTGALADSVEMNVDRTKHKLYIQAYGDDLREAHNRKYYAAYVDLGHEIVAWGNPTGKIQPPTAFMRRALYRRYDGF